MTASRSLDSYSFKELCALAERLKLKRWTGLRKAELREFLRERVEFEEAESSVKSASRKGRKKSAKDADEPADEPIAEPGRRRGRPKRVASPEAPALFDVNAEPSSDDSPVKPRRTRRAKSSPVKEESVAQPVVELESRSRRGRKKRPTSELDPSSDSFETNLEEIEPKKTRKRAKKAKDLFVAEGVEFADSSSEPVVEPPKKRRGRKSNIEKREEADERESVDKESVEIAVPPSASDVEPPKKRRGRKPKAEKQVAIVEPIVEEKVEEEKVVEVEVPVKKKRGRKPSKKTEVADGSPIFGTPGIVDEESEKETPKRGRKRRIVEETIPSLWGDEEEKEQTSSAVDEGDGGFLDDELLEIEEPKRTSESAIFPPPEPVSEQALALKEKLLSRKIVGSPNDRVDRLVLFVCDSYWLRACWEITPLLVDRVRSAMGRHWYTADPALRVFQVDRDGLGATGRRELVSELEIRGGVDNWYVPVDNPPSYFMVELGYRSRDGQFFTLASSNTVQTPQRFVRDSFGRSTIDDLNARVKWEVSSSGAGTAFKTSNDSSRPKPAPEAFPATPGFNRTDVDDKSTADEFYVDAEVVVKGRAASDTTVSIKDEPIPLRSDGTFSVRYSLPERRHVFPVVMTSRDGMETQTIVLSVDRNTKRLDPVFKEDDED